ncbi:MAG: hypothetical protein WB992_09510 [Bryobacteraceae bacterium]
MQGQARDGGCQLLCRADVPNNLGGQLSLQFMRSVRRCDGSIPDIFHDNVSHFSIQDTQDLR